MKIVLNEKQFAENAIQNGTIDKKPSKTLHIIAKYYYSLGMDAGQVRDNLENFMQQNYPNFILTRWQNKIEQITKQEKKNKKPLNNIEYIDITESELNTIRNIDSIGLEKLAFVLLVHAKMFNQLNGNESNWVNSNSKDIFKDCKVSVNIKEQNLMIFKLKNMELVGLSHKVDCESIKVNFVDNEGESLIRITDFRCFVYEYLKWRGENVIKCVECGVPIEKTGNKKTYCIDCGLTIEREKHKQRNKRWYKNKIRTE
jgi:hypothetical protein